MKLIFCKTCYDVKKLSKNMTYCNCGKCYGKYVDNLNAVINKEAIPLGVNNFSFASSINNRPKEGIGKTFEAFVISEECDTIKIIE